MNVALRVLPIDAEKPTHVALGWRPPSAPDSSSSTEREQAIEVVV